MAKVNSNYGKLADSYLFAEIAKRAATFTRDNPNATIYKLGIGDTTEAITPHVLEGLRRGVEKLGDVRTYSGYGNEQGNKALREAIAVFYTQRGVCLDSSEIFVSDGAKTDSANIQSIFSQDSVVAVQDPAYPVYVDSNVASGRTGEFNKERGQYDDLVYMPCNSENDFVPQIPSNLSGKKFPDLIYLCSPNNPTGAVMSRKSLEEFVGAARENKSIIIFDAAYSRYIKDQNMPQSIYEIAGAKECAIEINSFSKIAGFTGVRLGWAVVPKQAVTEDSEAGTLNRMWNRRQTTFFNGASNIAQDGGLEAFSPKGKEECSGLVNCYMNNAKMIRQGLELLNIKVFGGDNAPYLWMQNPNGIGSWEFFDKMLRETHVVTTPGVGFGPSGQGFTRLSSFGHRQDIEKAVTSIVHNLKI